MGGAIANLGKTLGIGDPPGTKTGKVMARLSQIPIEQRTSAEVFRIMAEEGVQRPAIMYEDISKSGFLLKESDLYKERQKERQKEQKQSANTLPLTPDIFQLVKEQLPPSVSSTYPTQPAEPLGRINVGGAQAPLTPELLQGLVPDLRTAPLPGQPPRELAGLPPAALFGPEAAPLLQGVPQPPGEAQPLPQVPVPGQTIPTTVVTQAAQAATATAKQPSVGTDREAMALTEFNLPFSALTPDQRKHVNQLVEQQELSRRRATGAEKVLEPKDLANLVEPGTLQPPKVRPKTIQEANAMGLRYVDPKYREANNAWVRSKGIVDDLTTLSQGLMTETDWVSAQRKGLELVAGAKTGKNAKARLYESQREAWVNLLAKVVTQQAGVLTERDTDRMRAAFAKFNDTKQVASTKMALLGQILEMERQAILANARGEFLDYAALRRQVNSGLQTLEQLDEEAEYQRWKFQQQTR